MIKFQNQLNRIPRKLRTTLSVLAAFVLILGIIAAVSAGTGSVSASNPATADTGEAQIGHSQFVTPLDYHAAEWALGAKAAKSMIGKTVTFEVIGAPKLSHVYAVPEGDPADWPTYTSTTGLAGAELTAAEEANAEWVTWWNDRKFVAASDGKSVQITVPSTYFLLQLAFEEAPTCEEKEGCAWSVTTAGGTYWKNPADTP